MTKLQRIWNVISGLVLLAVAFVFFLDPENGLDVAVWLLGLSFYYRGFGGIWYYLTMARHMVDGRTVLYRGLIYLDLAMLTSTMLGCNALILMLYLAGVNAFTGLVEVLRSREKKSAGDPGWKFQAAYGAASLTVAAALAISSLYLQSIRLIIYVYAAGLVYKSIVRLSSAFRRTAIVFIQ